MFLHAFQQGRYAASPLWLPQHQRNVEVIAKSANGETLAIEHTRVHAFAGHMMEEVLLRPIAERLESLRLPELSGKWVQIFFQPGFVGRLLQKHALLVQEELVRFLTLTLPTIQPREHHVYQFSVPIQLPDGRCPIIELGIEVWDNMDVKKPISVSGVLPQGRRLDSEVRQALENKLEKLVNANADIHFLLIDIPTHTESDISIAEIIEGMREEFPLLAGVDEIIFAKTFGFKAEGCIFFRAWNPKTRVWSETIMASVR